MADIDVTVNETNEVVSVTVNQPTAVTVDVTENNTTEEVTVTVAEMGLRGLPGIAGVVLTVSDTEPPNPNVNDLWIDTSESE